MKEMENYEKRMCTIRACVMYAMISSFGSNLE